VSRRKSTNLSLYFAFPDAVYTHVCSECDALCCHIGDFGGSMRREMGKLLNLYPALQNSVSARYGDFVTISTPGTCVFLESDNLCRIQKVHGNALKPTVCQLFPFNTINRIGKTVVVSPHFRCPLRLLLPANPGVAEGTHNVLAGKLRELNFLDESYLEHRAQPLPLHPSIAPEDVVTRESKFRDLCSQALGAERFVSVLTEVSSGRREFLRNLNRGAKILGFKDSVSRRSRDNIDDLLLAIAPAVRLKLLGLRPEGILLALSLGEIAYRQVMTLSNDRPTLQGLHHVFTNLGPALRLIGLIDEPIGYSKVAEVEGHPSWSPELKLAGRLILRQAQGSSSALDALERAIPAELSSADRSALLIQIGNLIEHSRGTEEAQRTQSE
jgi:Fe-S-cluster containining protein